MHDMREAILKVANEAVDSGDITTRQFRQISRRTRSRRTMAEFTTCCTDMAIARGIVKSGGLLDTITLDQLLAFLRGIFELISEFFLSNSSLSGDEDQ